MSAGAALRRRIVPAVVAAWVALAVAGCAAGGSSPGEDPRTSTPDVTATPTCPETLAEAVGGLEPAAGPPSIDAFGAAWLCEFTVADPASALLAPIADLEAVGALVDGLEPADVSLPCTADYGPSLVLVLDHGTTRTSLVFADYGCRTVFVVGEPGLLAGPPGSVSDLRDLAGL